MELPVSTMMDFGLRNVSLLYIWLSVAIASCICALGLAVYRLYFHPLARFPGPRLAAATNWYEVYYELIHKGGSQYAAKIRQLHAQYGPIVRINPGEISVNDAEFHDELYAPYPAVRYRDPSFSALLATNNGSFGTADHYVHRQRRVAYNPFFAASNLAAAEELMAQKVNHMCDLLWSRRDENPNIWTYLAALSFDSLFTMAFGRPLDLLDNLSLAEECNSTVELLATSPPVYRLFPGLVPLAEKLPVAILRRLSVHIARVFNLHQLILQSAERSVQEKADEKRSKSSPETLFSVIRRSKATEDEKAISRMSHEGVEMFMATFTSGRTMTHGLYYLHTHPDVLNRLRSEIAKAYPRTEDEMSFKTLNTLPYLRAVVKEILRITFPVGCRVPMVCDESMVYGEWAIPANTSISVNHRNLLFDPEVFREPHKFRPERWLDEAHPIDEKRYFVVFGKGTRNCPGKEFATQLIQYTLATLIQRFEFKLSSDTVFERDVKVSRESLVTSPSKESHGIKFSIVAKR